MEVAEAVPDPEFAEAFPFVEFDEMQEEVVGSPLRDERVGDTIHFALGDDSGLGVDTTRECRRGDVVVDLTVTVDGERLELP